MDFRDSTTDSLNHLWPPDPKALPRSLGLAHAHLNVFKAVR
jgi:hypothetical protein